MSASVPTPPERIEFSVFSLDLRTGELRKQGTRLKLQERSFQVLAMLVERPGELVSREQLRLRLWPNGTFVDFDHGISSAINRLRDSLGDSAATPRFIETVGRRGYRFVYPVKFHPSGQIVTSELPGILAGKKGPPVAVGIGHSVAVPSERDTPRECESLVPKIGLPTPSTMKIGRFSLLRTHWLLLIAGSIVLILVVVAARWWFLPRGTPRVVRSTRLSFIGKVAAPFPVFGEWFPAVVTDGNRIYFSTTQDATLKVAYLSVAGGDQALITTPLEDAELRHISPDGSLLLVYGSLPGQNDKHLWLVPTTGGGPRRLVGIDGHDGAWSSDGQRFVYAQGRDLYVAEQNGTNSRKLATTPGKAFWLRWSPDDSRMRFTLVDPTSNAQTLWECQTDGSQLHRLPISWDKQPQECCGEWAQHGTYVFRTFLDARADVWLISEPRISSKAYKPGRLTSGPIEFASAVLSRSGKQLFTVGVEPKWEVLSYNLKTQHARPWISDRSAFAPSVSRDGHWIAYAEVRGKESILWRSKPDGSERLQLSEPPLFVSIVRWSPDGKYIAFMGKMPDKPWNIYLVPIGGGLPRPLLEDGRNAVDPEWSADGYSLMYGRPPESWAEAGMPKAIYTMNLTSNEIRKLPGSDGLYSPRWSPDGRYAVAMPLDEKKLVLFDFSTQQWQDFATLPHIGNPQWSPDSNYIYIDGFDNVVVRIRRIDRKLERIVDLKSVDPNAVLCYFEGLTPDADLLLACPLARGDIYALDLELP